MKVIHITGYFEDRRRIHNGMLTMFCVKKHLKDVRTTFKGCHHIGTGPVQSSSRPFLPVEVKVVHRYTLALVALMLVGIVLAFWRRGREAEEASVNRGHPGHTARQSTKNEDESNDDANCSQTKSAISIADKLNQILPFVFVVNILSFDSFQTYAGCLGACLVRCPSFKDEISNQCLLIISEDKTESLISDHFRIVGRSACIDTC